MWDRRPAVADLDDAGCTRDPVNRHAGAVVTYRCFGEWRMVVGRKQEYDPSRRLGMEDAITAVMIILSDIISGWCCRCFFCGGITVA